ncbi:Probable L-type lectin-domain containing receptor kinase VII.2 [Linum grandiflorum]
MYAGFTAATGQLVQSHKILGWSISNSNFSIGEGLIVIGLPSFVLKSNSIVESKGFVICVTAGSFFVAICIGILIAVWLIKRSRRMKKKKKKKDEEEGMEDWNWNIGRIGFLTKRLNRRRKDLAKRTSSESAGTGRCRREFSPPPAAT